jgi:hypothetical protein
VKQELGLLLEAGIPDLLFRPFEYWVIRYIEVNNLSTREFHDDEYVENMKRNRVLHEEVARGNHAIRPAGFRWGIGIIISKSAI